MNRPYDRDDDEAPASENDERKFFLSLFVSLPLAVSASAMILSPTATHRFVVRLLAVVVDSVGFN